MSGEKQLQLIQEVNRLHLHMDAASDPLWPRLHAILTEKVAKRYFSKMEKMQGHKPVALAPLSKDDTLVAGPNFGNRHLATITVVSQEKSDKLLSKAKKELEAIYRDRAFTEPVCEALKRHILSSLQGDYELVDLLCMWVSANAIYLPLGTNLLQAFTDDMAGKTDFAKYSLPTYSCNIVDDATTEKVRLKMQAFLAEVAEAHARSCPSILPEGNHSRVAVVLTVKNGAGGHTAPHRAMQAQLELLGWKVEMIHYDTDLPLEYDLFHAFGVTFEDQTPMTENLFHTRWVAQKHKKEVSHIVRSYIAARAHFMSDLFVDNSGGELLRKKVLPLAPQLIVTTLAYNWTWKSLAYRIPSAKTLLVASDVFFNSRAIDPWYRQRSIAKELRKIHFTSQTGDLSLFKSNADHADAYAKEKYPNLEQPSSWQAWYAGLEFDEQITEIGAPIQPGFSAVTSEDAIRELRKKWQVPPGAISISISRGKLGFEADLVPALEAYRTDRELQKPIVLQVVCGENVPFYEKLCRGLFADLGPNITVRPHPLLEPADFGELRAISLVDDIKAGGGSAFEGWYLISEGSSSMLLLTPGRTLYWERSNCDAMQKWGVGRTVLEGQSKIPIIQELLEKGRPKITHRFPDWKEPFTKVVQLVGGHGP